MEKASWVFWAVTAVAVPSGFLFGPGSARWAAIAWLGAVGVLVSLSNWVLLYGNLRHGKRSSLIPILGGPLLALSLGAFSIERSSHLIILGGLLDPYLALILIAPLVVMARR